MQRGSGVFSIDHCVRDEALHFDFTEKLITPNARPGKGPPWVSDIHANSLARGPVVSVVVSGPTC